MPLHIVTEAERCLNCKKPLCQQYCPVQKMCLFRIWERHSFYVKFLTIVMYSLA